MIGMQFMDSLIMRDTILGLHGSCTIFHYSSLFPSGCGTGNYAAALSTHVGKVTGIELNDGMLAQAKQKTTTLPNVEVQKGNVLSLPFPNEQFDAVICNQVHYL